MKKPSKSGETGKKVVKTAATFLAKNEAERQAWICNAFNWPTIAGWAASLTGQAPNRRTKPKARPTSSRVLLSGARPKLSAVAGESVDVFKTSLSSKERNFNPRIKSVKNDGKNSQRVLRRGP